MNSVQLKPRGSIETRAGRIDDPIERLRYLRSRVVHQPNPAPPPKFRWRKLPAMSLALLLLLLLSPHYQASNRKESDPLPKIARVAQPKSADAFTKVWLVDTRGQLETYSNGLRIDDRYTTSNQPRLFYPVYQRNEIQPDEPEWRSEPAGIVYHTTESDMVHFDEGQNNKLKRVGKAVLEYVRQKRAYHFVIDRFGEVFRIVQESDIANHAGYSVWADDKVIYVNLNSSFIGIAFETQTQRGEDLPAANEAQIHAARTLTEMLRAKYRIPASNCLTHAQVSVNPDNMLVGYHTDWAANFPFLDLGLGDNYAEPTASIYTLGFAYDPVFVHATGARVWQGLTLAEDQLRVEATAHGLSISNYRTILRKKYKEILAALKSMSTAKEGDHAT